MYSTNFDAFIYKHLRRVAMKRQLFLILVLISFQASYANWEITSWKSGEAINRIWAQDSALILDGIKGRHVSAAIRGLTISLDGGKTFPIAHPTPEDVYFEDVVIVGKSLYIVGPDDLWRSDDWGASWTSKKMACLIIIIYHLESFWR